METLHFPKSQSTQIRPNSNQGLTDMLLDLKCRLLARLLAWLLGWLGGKGGRQKARLLARMKKLGNEKLPRQ